MMMIMIMKLMMMMMMMMIPSIITITAVVFMMTTKMIMTTMMIAVVSLMKYRSHYDGINDGINDNDNDNGNGNGGCTEVQKMTPPRRRRRRRTTGRGDQVHAEQQGHRHSLQQLDRRSSVTATGPATSSVVAIGTRRRRRRRHHHHLRTASRPTSAAKRTPSESAPHLVFLTVATATAAPGTASPTRRVVVTRMIDLTIGGRNRPSRTTVTTVVGGNGSTNVSVSLGAGSTRCHKNASERH
jgi:hypothetical protein